MATYNGRDARVTVNSNTTEAIVTELGNWSIDRTATDIDTSAFGDGWGKSDVGIRKWSGSMTGFYDPADTTGQAVLEDAFNSGELVSDIRFYLKYGTGSGTTVKYLTPDTATDPNAGIRINTFNTSTDKEGVATLTMNFGGSGPCLVVEETLI